MGMRIIFKWRAAIPRIGTCTALIGILFTTGADHCCRQMSCEVRKVAMKVGLLLVIAMDVVGAIARRSG